MSASPYYSYLTHRWRCEPLKVKPLTHLQWLILVNKLERMDAYDAYQRRGYRPATTSSGYPLARPAVMWLTGASNE